MGLDPKSGRGKSRDYREDYDLIEVFNGDQLEHGQEVEELVREWFALLSQGRRYVATGGSDSHRLPYQDVGYPRSFVQWKPDANEKDENPPGEEEALGALRAGRVVVSSGPLVRLTVDGQPLGSVVRAKAKAVLLHLVVDAPSWVDVSSVTVFENGKELLSTKPSGKGVRRLDLTRKLEPRRDSWYVALARGRRSDPTQQPRAAGAPRPAPPRTPSRARS